MEIGIIRETRPQEGRVAVTPNGVQSLVGAGHGVTVETRAGFGAGFADEEYLAAGADVALGALEVAQRAEMLVKVQAPTHEELDLLLPGRTLTGFLHIAGAEPALRERIATAGLSTVAYELVEESDGSRPLIEPLAEIGGRVAIALAMRHMLISGGGMGVLLGGVPGVPPQTVVVLGAGLAGESAARRAQQFGGLVVVLDRDPRRLAALAARLPHVVTAVASTYNLSRYVEQADLLVGAVAVRGHPTPLVLRRHHIRTMREGSIFVDMSIDEGGCSETSRPTTSEEPVYVDEGVRHICIPNLSAEVAHTSSRALANAFLPYLEALASGPLDHVVRRHPALDRATVTIGGRPR